MISVLTITIDCAYIEWTGWSECQPLEKGTWGQTRTRSCFAPPTSNSGQDCDGPLRQNEVKICYPGKMKNKPFRLSHLVCLIISWSASHYRVLMQLISQAQLYWNLSMFITFKACIVHQVAHHLSRGSKEAQKDVFNGWKNPVWIDPVCEHNLDSSSENF